jgi:hypothetical protein
MIHHGSTYIVADTYDDAMEEFYSMPINEIVDYSDLNESIDIQKIFERDLKEEYK